MPRHRPLSTSSDPPAEVEPTGVPGERAGREGLILTAALLVAVLALVFTLGWIVYHQVVPGSPPRTEPVPTQPAPGGGGGTDG